MSLQREGTVHRLLVPIPDLSEGEFLQRDENKRERDQRAESVKAPDP